MPFTLGCDQWIVKSVLQDQRCTFWSRKFAHSQESVVDKERPGRHQNNTAARSFLIDNTFWLLVNSLHQACIAGFVKHLSLCTGHNSGWIMAYALAFAHGKRITEYCSLRDTLNGNVAAFNVDKWRHSDVIIIKLTAVTQHKFRTKRILGFFIHWKLPKLCCFVTYLWNDPRIFALFSSQNIYLHIYRKSIYRYSCYLVDLGGGCMQNKTVFHELLSHFTCYQDIWKQIETSLESIYSKQMQNFILKQVNSK